MVALYCAVALSIVTADKQPLCDVFAWKMPSKNSDSFIYYWNHKEIGKGDDAARKCLALLQRSESKALIVAHGPAGPQISVFDDELREAFNKLFRTRSVTYLDGLHSNDSCIVTVDVTDNAVRITVNGVTEGDAFRDDSTLTNIAKSGGTIVMVCPASLMLSESDDGRQARDAYNRIPFRPGKLIRIDVPSVVSR